MYLHLILFSVIVFFTTYTLDVSLYKTADCPYKQYGYVHTLIQSSEGP